MCRKTNTMSEQIKKYTKPAEPIEAVLLTENNVEDVIKWIQSKKTDVTKPPTIKGEKIVWSGVHLYFGRYVVFRIRWFSSETVEYFEKTYSPSEPSEQNDKLTKEQILDQAKDFAYKMAEGKNRLGKNYPIGLMIGYDSGYRQATKDAGSLIQTYATGEQNEKLTAEEFKHMATHRTIAAALHWREIEHDGALLSFKKGFHEGYSLAARDKNQTVADHQKGTAELRKELERMGKNRDRHFERADKLGREIDRINTNNEKITSVLHQKVDVLQTQLAEAQRQRDELQSALQEIKDPVKFMKGRLKDGEELDVFYAIELSRDYSYLKGIADKALSRLSSGETKPVNCPVCDNTGKYEDIISTSGVHYSVTCPVCKGEMKKETLCNHPEWGTDGGGDYCKKCGFRLSIFNR